MATLGLIFALEGRNAVLRRSISRTRRFLHWLMLNLAGSFVIAMGAFLEWYNKHCHDPSIDEHMRASCNSAARESGRNYAIVEIAWAALCTVSALMVCRLLRDLEQQRGKVPRASTPVAADAVQMQLQQHAPVSRGAHTLNTAPDAPPVADPHLAAEARASDGHQVNV
eukprot:g8211.t1